MSLQQIPTEILIAHLDLPTLLILRCMSRTLAQKITPLLPHHREVLLCQAMFETVRRERAHLGLRRFSLYYAFIYTPAPSKKMEMFLVHLPTLLFQYQGLVPIPYYGVPPLSSRKEERRMIEIKSVPDLADLL